jgi:hypothetical protein
MEKAFWDSVLESVKEDQPNYDQIIQLMEEVRDEICEMAPISWKDDIIAAIDLDILSQVAAIFFSRACWTHLDIPNYNFSLSDF